MKVNWKDEKETLEQMVKDKVSYTEIGRVYGVSVNAVKKAAKRLGIDLPPRREINPIETFGKGKSDITEVCEYCGKEFKHPQHLGAVRFCTKECKDKFINNKELTKENNKINTSHWNHKKVGEIGERIAIGELAKYGIDVMLPMSDNLPFDLVVYYKNNFFKCQVKTSNSYTENNSISFSLSSNNWYSKTIHKYTNDEVDVYILCDLKNIYLLTFKESGGKKSFYIRNDATKSLQFKGVNYASDFIISQKRIDEVFNKYP